MRAQHRLAGIVIAATVAVGLSGCTFGNEADPPPDPPSTSADAQPSSAPAVPASASPSASTSPGGSAESAGPVNWEDTVDEVGTGVVRISQSGCEGWGGTGSGFMVGESHVVTNAHVVDGAAQVTVGPTAVPADIVGYSEEADLALLRTGDTLEGHAFAWGDEPRMLQEVVVLGYPLGGGFTASRGVVSSLDADVAQFPENVRYLQTDATVNPGNSGGPLVSSSGHVVGVITGGIDYSQSGRPIEGTSFALSLDEAQRLVQRWTASVETVPMVDCQVDPTIPEPISSDEVVVEVSSEHENAEAIAQTLALHGNAINTAQYDVAFEAFSPSMQERMVDVQTWEEGVYTSYWRSLHLEDVSGRGGDLVARVSLRTEQAAEYGPEGQSCSDWVIDYSMYVVEETGKWMIDEAAPVEDPRACD